MTFRNYLSSFAILGLLLVSCGNSEDEKYVPTEEFIPAYNALVNAKGYQCETDSTGNVVMVQCDSTDLDDKFYDIEETVRILNGLELAQMHAEDFYSYLEYMSKQDYSMVPNDVLEAKMKLLPILQEMFILESQNEELQGLTSVMNSLGTGIYAYANERKASDSVSGVIDVVNALYNPITGIISAVSIAANISTVVGGEALDKAQAAALDHYQQQKELKSENSKRLDRLKAKYLAYLEEFTPVYMKYMNEWEQLCLDKDKAYLAVYSGRSVEGYSLAQEILDKNPVNKDAMLLKALACINLAKGNANPASGDASTLTVGERSTAQKQKYIIEAQNTLNNYISLFPGKAAPALLLLGEVELMSGNEEKALSLFDQSAIEYPKLAAELRDVINVNSLRSYMNATPEGQYLMRLYNSTIQGYGWFSPNFHKAMYWEYKGDTEKASVEIHNHFFRRGNQGIYDCLLTDMEFCENNIYRSFKSQFMESSMLNVSITEGFNLFGNNGIKITLTNNADINLENVRLYICMHMKDMYVSEYSVLKCKTINMLAPGAIHTWDEKEYEAEDIVRVRAILMTDDRVCWVDDVSFKQANAKKQYYSSNGKNSKSLNVFEEEGLSENEVKDGLLSGMAGQLITKESTFFKKMVGNKDQECLAIELPRYLCLIDPVFSLGELSKNCTPSKQFLEGSVIRLEFLRAPGAPYEPLYLYSDFINMKIDYVLNSGNGKLKVTSVEKI